MSLFLFCWPSLLDRVITGTKCFLVSLLCCVFIFIHASMIERSVANSPEFVLINNVMIKNNE